MNHAPQPGRALPPQWSWQEGRGASEEGREALTPFATLPAAFVGAAQRSWQWTPGAVGQTLLIEASAGPILEALSSIETRTAHLALEESPPPPLSMDVLGRELNAYTSDFPGFAAIYVQDLTTGEEAVVDVDVAFSGMSTLKIAIVSEAFRQLSDFENEAVGQWIDFALGESNNAAANRLLQWVGGRRYLCRRAAGDGDDARPGLYELIYPDRLRRQVDPQPDPDGGQQPHGLEHEPGYASAIDAGGDGAAAGGDLPLPGGGGAVAGDVRRRDHAGRVRGDSLLCQP